MRLPQTRYARSDEYHIAYQVLGEGSVDLLYVPGWISQLDLYWEEPSVARFFQRLASFSRLIVFDKRGIGLSDGIPEGQLPTLEERMDDIRAVLDAAGSERAAVMGQGYGTPIAALFAATYPERTSALVLYSPVAKTGLKTDDYPWASSPDERDEWRQRSTEAWGTKEFAAEWLARLAPSAAGDARAVDWVARVMRAAASPAASRSHGDMTSLMDVREILSTIRVPTLVLARGGQAPKGGIDTDVGPEAEYVATRIPGAQLVTLPGRDYLPWVGDQGALVSEVAAFVTGARPRVEVDRVLVTVLFTDIVGSTDRAAQLGDRAWRDLLEAHNVVVRRELERFGGREIDRAGDGFLVTFEGPARAIRCGLAVVSEVAGLGLDVRVGVHSGEVELVESGIGGITVHVGARIAASAGPGEVLVSGTVSDLVAGSGLEFVDRGEHELRGVPGRRRLFAVAADARPG